MKEVSKGVFRLESGVDGPHLMVLGGVHGNETPGIVEVARLLARFRHDPSELKAGTLTIGYGNLPAIARNTRGSGPHLDLNRSFTDECLADPSVYEHGRAAELAALMDEVDYLVDLHATNKPSEAFLATTAFTPHHAVLANCFPCRKLLLVEPTALTGTTDDWMHRERGRVGFIFESGHAHDPATFGKNAEAMRNVLGILEMTDDPHPKVDYQRMLMEFDVYALKHPILLTDAGFTFAPGRGERSFEPMNKGDLIGWAGPDEVRAPFGGVLMFPKVPELWKIGYPVATFALGIENEDDPPRPC